MVQKNFFMYIYIYIYKFIYNIYKYIYIYISNIKLNLCQNMKLNPSTRISSSVELTTWEILDNIWTYGFYTFHYKSKKVFFKEFFKPKFNCLTQFFSYSLLPKILKFTGLFVVCSYKDCDQFLPLKNYRFWH